MSGVGVPQRERRRIFDPKKKPVPEPIRILPDPKPEPKKEPAPVKEPVTVPEREKVTP